MSVQCWIPIDGEEFALILSRSTVEPSGWRLTSWDRVGPVGHTEHETLDGAQKSLSERIGPWPACPELGIKARPCTHRRVETEPVWLGLTVITNGRIEQAA